MKKLFLLFFAPFMPIMLAAQNFLDYQVYMESAKERSIIFRGELPFIYIRYAANDKSTYFAYSENFEIGDVHYRDKLYKNIPLNLNAHRDELYVKDSLRGIAFVMNRNYVDSFAIGKHKFVSYKQEENALLKDGYYEVLYSGEVKLYKKIRKQFYEKIYNNSELRKGFSLIETFYLWKEDRWYRISAKSDLKKLYDPQWRVIHNFIRTEKLAFKRDKERALTEILIFLDQI